MARIDVREKLLEAGVLTFRRAGFHGCSVQDITEAAGVPKGSFYNHFESKEALGAAALEHYWQAFAGEHLAILADPDRPPRERLRSYFEKWAAEMATAEFQCGCLIGNMAAELADQSALIAASLSGIFKGWTRQVSDCIRAGQAVGDIKSGADPDTLAAFVLNAWEGALQRARLEKADGPLRQFIDTLFSQLL
jgi:TetR/AcrR family transcriptional repressor of nem operon